MDTIRVLVADDHTAFRSTLTSYLRRQPGVEVVGEVADGASAVEQAQLLNPDLVVVDVRMPHMNGIDATREIKSKNPDVRVVVMSFGQSDVYRDLALKNLADAFVEKNSLRSLVAAMFPTATTELAAA